MRSGRLRHRLTLQSRQTIRNDFGEEEESWVDGASFQADVRDMKGREYFDAKQINSDISVEVICRYRTDIKPENRLVTRSGRVLEVVAPPADSEGRRRKLLIMCKEIL
ncbi:phage head closure protein [Sansalvadorimonas verongulae]|uniref:phage head closure protein n=1 Tax=Sansalvadorimonas verongulae TaxID=2172824 RepID=UPI0012BCC927|nr:phage head closure protein [Sansalvadorimonas verongulae]MTI12635.1 head-tail adaptor protein [Sansalvadorimonas verongulae]